MRNVVIVALLVVLTAGTVMAQSVQTTIPEIRTGMIPELTQVDVIGGMAVVTAVSYNGFSCTDPAVAAYSAIWVYTGGAPAVAIGDVVDIVNGMYKEYYDLSEIDMTTFAGTVTVVGTAPVPCLSMSLATLLGDPEPWESHVINVTDGFTITELLDHGQWIAEAYGTGLTLTHDDMFFDETVLAVGDCYMCVTGMFTYSYGAFKINPLDCGLTVVDCTVGNDVMSFGDLKSNYR